MKHKKKKLSKISALHYFKLKLRSALLLVTLVFYILDRTDILTQNIVIPIIVWVFFIVGMLLRFFPSKFESMGCQKQFARNYEPVAQQTVPVNQSWKTTALVAVVWLALNGFIGALYFAGIIDRGILILIALAYSVCDIVCILFFCPFQTWFMKNRCCVSCRIYNWDYAMMFTPLIFVPDVLTYTLLGLGLALVARWEVTRLLHPKRFNLKCNGAMSCRNCKEKLCRHKKQLRNFILKQKLRLKKYD